MDDDQQFCLRWNNHQSTLISVFDTLLENGTLVDCTLAAEGKFLKAHKVVLSACSPYFAALLSQQYDKHPIFILKDVKFQELRAMMDYMYRGEVNISQDQLAALLKAAESLQIKGLSDSRGSTSSQKSEATTSKTLQPQVPVNKASGLTIENKRPLKALGTDILDTDISVSREGSTSPTSRKRKKIRRKSLESNNLLDNHDQHSNSSSQSMHINTVTSLANQSSTSTTVANTNNNATSLSVPSNNVANIKKTENIHQHQQQSDALKHQIKQQQQPDDDDDDDDGNDEDDENINDSDMENEDESQSIKHKDIKSLTQSELMIEPKNEYDDGNDENVEDLTLDDEELLEDMEQPGPSHGGEGSSQGYAQWQMDRAPDEAFMGQEGGGQHRDAQDDVNNRHRQSAAANLYAQQPKINITPSSRGPSFSPSHLLMKHVNHQKLTDISLPTTNANYYHFPVMPHTIEINAIPINIFKNNVPKKNLTKSKEPTTRRQSAICIIPLKCLLCTQVFKSQGHLNEHMRRDHSVLI